MMSDEMLKRSLSLPQMGQDVENKKQQREKILHEKIWESREEMIKPLMPKLTPQTSANKSFNATISEFANSNLISESQKTIQKRKEEKKNTIRQGNVNTKIPQFSMLHGAAIMGDKIGLQKLIAGEFCNINLLDKFGRTPLMFAAFADFPNCVELLLKSNSDPHLKDRSGRTAMHWAAHHGHVKSLKVLITHIKKTSSNLSAILTAGDESGVTLLHLSTRNAQHKCLNLLHKLCSIGAKEVNIQDKNNRTSLHWAASQGCYEYVGLLLNHGAQVDIPDVEGKTPLHWAASSAGAISKKKMATTKDHDPITTVQLLMAANISVLNWQDYEGRMALHLAVADGNFEVVKAFLENSRTQINTLDKNLHCPLHWAAILGKSQVCNILLEFGARYQSRDGNGATPLHFAVKSGHVKAVEVLMRWPEAQDIPDLRGQTALMWAASINYGLPEKHSTTEDVIKVLCRHGSKLNHTDHFGNTALHIAVANNNFRAVDVLLKLGCKRDTPNEDGQSPVCLSAFLGNEEMLKLFMDKTTRNTCADQHQHLVELASLRGHTRLIEILLEFSANFDLNLKNKFGRTFLMLSSYGGYTDCMEFLIQKGSDVSAQDNEGMNALHWTTFRGHLDAAKLLITHGSPTNALAFGDLEKRQSDPKSQTKIVDPKVSNVSSGIKWDDYFTALDISLVRDHNEISKFLMSAGCLTSKRVLNESATKIQAFFRGFGIRKTFNEHRKLLLRHEKLKAEKKRTKQVEHKNARDEFKPFINPSSMNLAGQFLSHMVQAKHNSAFQRKVETQKEFETK